MSIKTVESISSIIQNGFTIAAIIAGAIWTFFHYFKGRTFKPRLELRISGALQNGDNSRYLIAKVSLKNVGLSKLEIQQKGTGMRIISLDDVPRGNKVKRLKGNTLRTVAVFKEHESIEPNETIDDVQVFSLPHKGKNILLDARVVSRRVAWRAKCMVGCSIEKEKKQDESVQ